MLAEPSHRPAVRGDRPGIVDGAEVGQQRPGGRQRRRRWGREPGQARGIGHAPGREFEGERREIGVENFRRRKGQQPALSFLGPQPVAHAGLEAAGAAAALVGRGLAHPHRLQPRHAGARRESRHAHQAAVDHDPHALDGEAGLGDRGCEHDLAPSGRRGGDGTVLLGGREVAVERRDVDGGIEAIQPLLDAADLADPGQEHQCAAALLGQRPSDGGRHRVLDPARGLAVEMTRLDREHAAGRFDQGRTAETVHDGAGIQGRRHGNDAQVLAQRHLGLAHEREGKVGVQPALVQFVEDHAADAVERRVVLQQAQEQAVGDDLDAGARADPGVEAHAVAHGLAHGLAQAGRHAARGGAGGQAPRLLHDDPAPLQPGRVEQRQRDARGLAGAWRGHEHGGIAGSQRLFQARQGFIDRKGVHRRRL